MNSFKQWLLCSALCAGSFLLPNGARASETSAGSGAIEEVIVTAQKVEQNINNVGMSIQALSRDDMANRGVVQVQELVKVVPGFNYTPGSYGAPVLTIRGIGFYDTTLGASPAVSAYVDEVPLPYPVLTSGAFLDLERVEVLKGPQGTLFGENSTGGAINFIAAKPTEDFTSGVNLSYGRFNTVDAGGFMSGALSNTVRARAAVSFEHNDDWQHSYTRNDSLGSANLLKGRLLFDVQPNDELLIRLSVTGWHERSDEQAGQFISFIGPARLNPGFVNYPQSPRNDQAADWDANTEPYRRQDFIQGSMRINYHANDHINLTSITSYLTLDRKALKDVDGTSFQDVNAYNPGGIRSFYQEVRADGKLTESLKYIVGGNYQRDHAYDEVDIRIADSSFPIKGANSNGLQHIRTAAVFGDLDWNVLQDVKLQGAARYTSVKTSYQGCLSDTGAGDASALFAGISRRITGVAITIPPGSCVTIGARGLPGNVFGQLSEHNVSWRLGVEWQAQENTLLYTNVSRGYKSGGFPTLGATFAPSLDPAHQESVTAYEAGFKLGLADHTAQLTGAGFYYDYKNKQVKGSVLDAVFGRLNKLINIPKSRVQGAELGVTWLPVSNLILKVDGTYVDSKIKGPFVNIGVQSEIKDLGGESFPLTPKWQAVASGEYTFPLSGNLQGFFGTDITYQSGTNAGLGADAVAAIKGYALLDLRAGVKSADDKWRATAFLKNATNTYYWTYVSFTQFDTRSRYAGMPRTYGVSLSYLF